MDFLSEITEHFVNYTFVSDDFVFMENDKSESIIYILEGKVAMLHKLSHTFIKDIGKEQHIGEIGVLKEQPRSLSAKVRDYTTAFVLKK